MTKIMKVKNIIKNLNNSQKIPRCKKIYIKKVKIVKISRNYNNLYTLEITGHKCVE